MRRPGGRRRGRPPVGVSMRTDDVVRCGAPGCKAERENADRRANTEGRESVQLEAWRKWPGDERKVREHAGKTGITGEKSGYSSYKRKQEK